MVSRNNGIGENEILQNQFTAYVKRAIHNRRLRYLTVTARRNCFEQEMPLAELFAAGTEDMVTDVLEHEMLRLALGKIRELERIIVLGRAVNEKSFDELASELGMTYRAVSSMYYRAMKKLRRHMEGGDEE